MRSLLLDRDGVLIEERGYDYVPDTIRLLPGVVDGLKQLSGYQFFVVSNQSGVARGLTTIEDVEACNARLKELLAAEGIELQDIAYCPHHPDENCACRKPKTGMWDQLASKHQLQKEDCIMIGNRPSDTAFGRAIGCFTILVGDLYDKEQLPDLIVQDVPTVASYLLRHPTLEAPVMSIEQAEKLSAEWRRAGKKIVTTNGSFDLLHDGHRYLFEQARSQGDILIVGVNSDASVRSYKGPDRPIETDEVRARKVAAYADSVFIFHDLDPRGWLPLIRPHVHANATTYGEDCIEAPVLKEIGAELYLVPVQQNLGSTSDILKKRSASKP